MRRCVPLLSRCESSGLFPHSPGAESSLQMRRALLVKALFVERNIAVIKVMITHLAELCSQLCTTFLNLFRSSLTVSLSSSENITTTPSVLLPSLINVPGILCVLRSQEFKDFLKKSLDKNPESRPDAAQLLEVS